MPKVMLSIYKALDRALRLIENAAAIIAGCIMLSAMVLVALDAFLRYLFNAPLQLQYHLTQHYLLVALITMALAWGYRTGGYIRIDGLIGHLPAALRDLVLRGGLLMSSAYIAVLAWKGGQHFWKTYEAGDVQLGLIDWPISWSWVWIPVGCGLLAARLLLISVGPRNDLDAGADHAEETV